MKSLIVFAAITVVATTLLLLRDMWQCCQKMDKTGYYDSQKDYGGWD